MIAYPPGFASDVHDDGTWVFVGKWPRGVETVYRAEGLGPDGLVAL